MPRRAPSRLVSVVATLLAACLVMTLPGDTTQATNSVLDAIARISPAAADRLRPYAGLLEPDAARARGLPADPQADLARAVARMSDQLGFAQDAAAVLTAGLSPEIAGRLTILLQELAVCHTVTTRYRAELFQRLGTLFRELYGLYATDFPEIVLCAQRVRTALFNLEMASVTGLQRAADGCPMLSGRAVDLWPVLRIEPGCGAQRYANDYLVILDAGGDDEYANNAGSNVIDLNFAPPDSAVSGLRGTGPAQGCQRGLAGLFRDDCYLAAAVLLDLDGSDTYGFREAPDHDQLCTRDPVVRRMLTGGVGVLGVGILRDVGGDDDRYTGKTVSLGAAHLFGVGVLSDDGGDDEYLAVRNSQGFALMGGLGLLHDSAGNDSYDYYMPAPIDPTAPNQAPGAGGVRDNEGEGSCDHVARYTLGAANLLESAIGVLIDASGDDTYRAAFATDYVTTPAIPGMALTGGSLGYGGNLALGVFFDRGGTDTYHIDSGPDDGEPWRSDRLVMQPGDRSTGEHGSGLFVDA